MGVDYEANFGIGVEIEEIKFYENSDYSDMDDYLFDLLDGTNYEYKSYGWEYYGGETNIYLILMKDPFKNGYDIRNKVKEMEEFLNQYKIKFDKIDIVGGLLVY